MSKEDNNELMAKEDHQDFLLFITGPARSGTTILNRVLNTHPDIAVFTEVDLHGLEHVSKYSDRTDAAGRLTRRFIDEMDHLWLFLKEAGVAPDEQSRCAVAKSQLWHRQRKQRTFCGTNPLPAPDLPTSREERISGSRRCHNCLLRWYQSRNRLDS